MPKPKDTVALACQTGRKRLGHSGANLAQFMREAGFDWKPETVKAVENSRRRVTLKELAALATIQRQPYSDYIDGLSTESQSTNSRWEDCAADLDIPLLAAAG